MLFTKQPVPAQEQTTIPEEDLTPQQLSRQIVQELEGVEQRFNMTSDPDLIDAFIFERAALMARLRHLLRTQKELHPSEFDPLILRK